MFVATEPGHKYIPEAQRSLLIQVDPDTGWTPFLDSIQGLKNSKPKTVVVDTVAGLYSACMEFVCRANNWKHPEDGPHGKGWAAVKREFYRGLMRLTNMCTKLGATVILISHTKTEEIRTDTAAYQKVMAALPGQARGIIMPVPDHVWFLGYSEKSGVDSMKNFQNNRCLWLKGTDVVEAGCRDPNVVTNRIRPLHKSNPYQQIIAAFNKKKDHE